MSGNNKIKVWYLVCVALAVRAAVPLVTLLATQDFTLFSAPDSSSYIRPAQELLSYGQFYAKGAPELFRTPGYPVFLIPGVLLGNIEAVTIVLQVLLSCLTTVLVYRISLILFEHYQIAVLSAFLYAIEPLSIVYASKILSETLFTFVNTVSLYYLVRYFKNTSLKELILASLMLSASVYVRPANYYLPVLIALLLAMWSFTKEKWVRLLLHAALFLVCSFALIGLWQLRNYTEAQYAGFSTVSDINLYCYQGAAVLAATEKVPYYEMQQRLCPGKGRYPLIHPEQRSVKEGKVYHDIKEAGKEIILKEPALYLRIHVEGMVRTLIDPGITEYLILFRKYSRSGGVMGEILDHGFLKAFMNFMKTMPIFFVSILILSGMYLTISLLASIRALSHRKFIYSISIVSVLCILCYQLLVSGGPVGYHRFRVPMMPLVSLLSGYGLYTLFIRMSKGKDTRRYEDDDFAKGIKNTPF